MATEIVSESGALHRPLNYTPIARAGSAGPRTNTQATRLVMELRKWAEQFNHDDARELCRGLDEVQGLFVTVWTEIDESLVRLSGAARDLQTPIERSESATEQLNCAMRMLHRWQDRGGRMGNVEFVGRVRREAHHV